MGVVRRATVRRPAVRPSVKIGGRTVGPGVARRWLREVLMWVRVRVVLREAMRRRVAVPVRSVLWRKDVGRTRVAVWLLRKAPGWRLILCCIVPYRIALHKPVRRRVGVSQLTLQRAVVALCRRRWRCRSQRLRGVRSQGNVDVVVESCGFSRGCLRLLDNRCLGGHSAARRAALQWSRVVRRRSRVCHISRWRLQCTLTHSIRSSSQRRLWQKIVCEQRLCAIGCGAPRDSKERTARALVARRPSAAGQQHSFPKELTTERAREVRCNDSGRGRGRGLLRRAARDGDAKARVKARSVGAVHFAF